MNTKNLTTFPQTEAIPAPLEIHPSVSPKAAELLMKVAEVLAQTPELYRQECLCGTPCCIIGHIYRLQGRSPFDTDGCQGLTCWQHQRLCETWRWPKHIVDLPEGNYGRNISAAQGIARIEHFLRTGE